MRRQTFLGLALLAMTLSVTGCATTNAEAEPSRTATATPTPTKEALPAVSLATTCDLIYGRNLDGPVPDSQDIISRFVENPDLSTVTEAEIETTIDAIETAARSADPALVPFLNAQVAPLDQLLEAIQGKSNSTVNFDDYKASGLELLNQCEQYLL